MSDKIKIDIDELKAQSIKFNKCNEEIENEFENLKKQIRKLENNWDSNAKNNVMDSFEDLKKKFNSRKSSAKNCFKFINTVVNPGYEETEETNTNISDLFK